MASGKGNASIQKLKEFSDSQNVRYMVISHSVAYTAPEIAALAHESVYTKAEDWVWASPQKQGRDPYWPQTIMRRVIQPAAAAAGITKHIGWHTFRHTFSTLIKSLGVDAKVVQELMRHASFRTTMDAYTQALD